MPFHHKWLLLSGAALLTLSCAAVLGIEDAELDPLLNQGGNNTGGGDLCAQYCEEVTINCTENFQQYSGIAVCGEVCSRFPAGNPDEPDPIGNTIACRFKNAKESALDVLGTEECEGAGPGSDGACSSNCESWCLLFESFCEPEFLAAYSNAGDCREDCQDNIPALNQPFSSTLHTEGDHIQCRLYHVSQASLDRDTHCPHAAGLEEPCLAMGTGGMGGMGGMGGAGGN